MVGPHLKKKVVGSLAVTGGLGSGKSSVAAFLAREAAARFVDADVVCRDLLEPGTPGWLAFAAAFGDDFFLPDHRLNRPLLRKNIFLDKALRERVNRLLHPLARRAVRQTMQETRADGSASLIVVEVPLLYEAGWQEDFDATLVVYADPRACFQRVMRRDGISWQEMEAASAAQWPLAEKVLRGEFVVDNSGPVANTHLQVLHLARLLVR